MHGWMEDAHAMTRDTGSPEPVYQISYNNSNLLCNDIITFFSHGVEFKRDRREPTPVVLSGRFGIGTVVVAKPGPVDLDA